MRESEHWSEDRYWTDALERFQEMEEQGTSRLTLDLNAIKEVAYNGDGPAYKLMNAMVSVKELEGWDGCKGAPRVMLALLVRLSEITRGQGSSSQS